MSDTAEPAKAILVVGMHRSGTSALTRVLNLLGVDLPKNVLGSGIGNELGHWEPDSAVGLHREMLADAGSATNSPINFPPSWFEGPSAAVFEERIAKLVEYEYGSSKLFVMKEPRAALLLPAWIRALERQGIKPHFVIPFRHPVEVARSLTARQQAAQPHSIWPTARGLALWLRYVLAAEKSTRGYRRSFVAYDALLSQWRREVARIARQLDITWPLEPEKAAAEIDKFLNARHRHQTAADEDALHGMPRVVAQIYASLQEAVGVPIAQTDIFDRATRDTAIGEEMLAPYVTRMEAKLEFSGSPTGRKIVYISGAPTAPEHIDRVERFVESARRLGHRATIVPVQDAVAHHSEIDGADIVVIWRGAWSQPIEEVIKRVRATGAKLIVDVDDKIFEPETSNGEENVDFDATDIKKRFSFIEKTISCADLCTAASQNIIDQLRDFSKPLFLLRGGFDEKAYVASQLGAETRRRGPRNKIRIGFTENATQIARAEPLLVRLLDKYQNAILVLLAENLKLEQFSSLRIFIDRIEQRGAVMPAAMPSEFARLDIAALLPATRQQPEGVESETSYIHAALARVPMVAFASDFLLNEIKPGITGLLAQKEDEWLEQIGKLVNDARLRQTIGDNALHDVMWRYGPEGRDRHFGIVLDYLFSSGQKAADAFRAHIAEIRKPDFARPATPDYDIVFETERKAASPVAVIVPLYNYAQYVEEALESVKHQTLGPIDLIVVDDCSTDSSLSVARRWIEDNQSRFNHAALLHNKTNSKLGPTRNVAFGFTSARYIMPLDADNILLPTCLERCLTALESSGAAAAFPVLKQFGGADKLLGDQPWQAAQLAGSNYIDAMAMIRKAAWAACGGYASIPSREDYELWMKFIERGFWAAHVPDVLAFYRVHPASLVYTYGPEHMTKDGFWQTMATAHPWIALPTWSKTKER